MDLELWRRELNLALRGALRRPAATFATILTLGAGIGAATALFSVVDALALRPLPGVRGSGLVNVYRTTGGAHDPFSGHALPTFHDLALRNRSLANLAAFTGRGLSLDAGNGPELVGLQLVSGRYFDVLGTRPALGRLLSEADERSGSEALVVSHAFWQQRLDSAPDVVGRVVRVNGQPFTVVGVAEPGFRGHFTGFPFDAYVSLEAAERVAKDLDLRSRAVADLELIGRVAPGTTPEQSHADLSRVASQLAREYPDALRDASVLVEPWTGLDRDLRGSVLGFVGLLLVVATLVLLVACANVAGLATARALERRREMALRLALGADRRALVRQIAAETLAPFAIGGALGLLLAGRAADALHHFLPSFPLPLRLDLALDARVALFATALSLIAGLAFGLLPALGAAGLDVAAGLRLASRGATGRQPLRRLFVAGQVALTFALLVTAGLFGRVLQEARGLETGFDATDVVVATADVRTLDRDEPAGRRFFDGWIEQAGALPGVEAVAVARSLPLGFGGLSARVSVDGTPAPTDGGFAAGWNAVSPGYFEALRLPVLAGRNFDVGDAADAERVAILSRSTALRLFAGREPVGGRVRRGEEVLRVVGVVADAAHRRAGVTDDLFFYVPFAQSYAPRMSLIARGGPSPGLREAARALEPDLPLIALQPLEQHLAVSLFPQRMAAAVAAAFGGLGLVLAIVGLYALLAAQVAEQRRELAVRLVLGATRDDLRRLVVGGALHTVGLGLAAGTAAAVVVGRLAAAFLPGVSPLDPATFAGAAVTLVAVAAVAAELPARRAGAADPGEALRAE